MNTGAAGWLGWIIGLGTVITAFIVNLRRGKVDESALVLGKWKELVETHEKRIKALQDESELLRGRLIEAEKRIHDQEERLHAQDERIRTLENENEGLRRTIAQNAQSSPLILGNHVSGDVLRAAERARKARDDKENGK